MAAATLGAIGTYSLARSPAPRATLFRAIPVLFAAHQLTEGFIWRAWTSRTSWRIDSWLVQLWLLVALAVWPAWMPLSCALLEPRSRRRELLVALAIAGAVFGAWLFGHARMQGPWSCVLRGHLYHAVQLARPMQPMVHLVYLLCVLAPLGISTAPGARRLGVAFLAAWIACASIDRTTVISVWCFFAAWLSVLVVRVEMPRHVPGAPRTG